VVEAYGKHLLVRFAGGRTVHVHLGMRGKLLRFPDVSRPPGPRCGSGWPAPMPPGT
jgi:formamidopyrimidine-DNA glycosylase